MAGILIVKELITFLGYDIDDKNLKKYDSQLSSVSGVLKSVGKAALATGIAMAAVGGAAFAKKLFDVNVQFEQLFGMLKTATGGLEQAKEQFKKLQDFTTTTPFQLEGVTRAFVKLKNLGIDSSIPAMKAYGNIAAALGDTLNETTVAVVGATKFQKLSFARLGISSEIAGKKIKLTFQGQTTTIDKSKEAVLGYIKAIGNGRFATAMADQMNTIPGILSNIQDQTDKFFVTVGKSGVNDAFREILKAVVGVQEGTGGLAVAIGQGLGSAISFVFNGVKTLVGAWDSLKAIGGKALDSMKDHPLWLIIEDVIVFFQGGNSVVGGMFDSPELADFIKFLEQMQAEILPELLELFDEMKNQVFALGAEIFQAGGDSEASFGSVIPVLKDFIKFFFEMIKNVVEFSILMIRVARVIVPPMLQAGLRILAFWVFVFSKIASAIIFMATSVQLLVSSIITGVKVGLAIVTGDFDEAVDLWLAQLQKVGDFLRGLGLDVSVLEGAIKGVASFAGVDVKGGEARAAARAGGAGGTSNTNVTGGKTTVVIQGQTNMGPDEVAKATAAGQSVANEQLVKDINLNLQGGIA